MKRVGAASLLVILALPLAAASPEGDATLLVHLPSAPIENANRLAAAVTALGSYLNERVPGLELQVQMFRRREDAATYLESHRDQVIAVLAEASFLLDWPAGSGLVPAYRFVRDGEETHRRVVIVRSDRQDLNTLADLRGKRLTVVETSGSTTPAFLERSVFESELDPATWFGGLEPITDDFSATAQVLYAQSDAALVTLDNPLLKTNLDGQLRIVYTSPRLSLPVLALRLDRLEEEQMRGLETAFADISESERAAELMTELKLEAIRPIAAGSGPFDRQALLSLPKRGRKTLEIAMPAAPLPDLDAAASEAALGISLVMPLPQVPPAAELVEAETLRNGGDASRPRG